MEIREKEHEKMKSGKAFNQEKYLLWIDPNDVVPYEKNAKQHTEKQIKNIVNSIKKFGWQQDVVITSDNVLVIGHGRRLAALKLGCKMPYHVIDKKADDLTDEDIRELRIADNQTNAETGLDFDILEEEISDLDFEGFDFDFGIKEESKKDDKYTTATNIPQYEPNENVPALSSLIHREKVDSMLEEIDGSDITEEEKEFLRIAAYRHAIIEFDKVADYYASATPAMQRLMERSALVLIDINDAIANGYTTLTKALDDIFEEDLND